jgi:hypothetical protein
MRPIVLTFLPLFAMSLGACAAKPMRTGGPLPPQVQSCRAEAAQSAVGAKATPERIEQVRLQSHSRTARVLRPGQVVTMEFNGERVNIHADAQDVILAVTCG